MGIFGKLFGKSGQKNDLPPESSNAENLVQIPGHKEEWDSYMTYVDDIIGSIMLDLGFYSVAPVPELPSVMWIALTMNNPREDGLSDSEEANKLFEIEDALVDYITQKHPAIFVGRLTSNKIRSFYFYAGDTSSYEKTIKDVMSHFPDYHYEYGEKEDANWEGYFDFLYPMPKQYRGIMDRRVIHNLEKHGDILSAPREVDHWIYFKTEDDRENFLTAISNDNFNILNKEEVEDSEYTYMLHISRIDPVDHQSVDEYVTKLWETADHHNGYYDGWGAAIVKE